MGIILRVKQYFANKLSSMAKQAANAISTAAALSPKQIQEIEARKGEYLRLLPNRGNENLIAERKLAKVIVETEQEYILQLGRNELYSPVANIMDNFDTDNRIRYFDITRWTKDKDELAIKNLTTVYNVMSKEPDCNIALIFNRTAEKCSVSFGIVNGKARESDPSLADKYSERVANAFEGIFPGAVIKNNDPDNQDFGIGLPPCLENLIENCERTKSVAIVSNIASERSKDFISQGIEKLLDSYVPKERSEEYTLLLIANPVTDLKERKNYLSSLQTELAPYVSIQENVGYQESGWASSSFNAGVYAGVHAGVGAGMNISSGKSSSDSTTTIPDKKKDPTQTHSDTHSHGTGINAGAHAGGNFGVNFARASNETLSAGRNKNITKTFTNYSIKHEIELLDSRIKRLEEGNGLWEFAAYIVSEDPSMAKNVASMYHSLTQGEKSYSATNDINFWDGYTDSDAAKVILAYIQRLQHPLFGLKNNLPDEWLCYPSLTTPSIAITGQELAKAMNFPRKSVPGLQVTENAPFGRDANHKESASKEGLDIGCLYHMRTIFEEQRFFLSKNDLTKHTFITGSTGSGKTNTVYNILGEK